MVNRSIERLGRVSVGNLRSVRTGHVTFFSEQSQITDPSNADAGVRVSFVSEAAWNDRHIRTNSLRGGEVGRKRTQGSLMS